MTKDAVDQSGVDFKNMIFRTLEYGFNGPDHIRAFVGGQGGEASYFCFISDYSPILWMIKKNVIKVELIVLHEKLFF